MKKRLPNIFVGQPLFLTHLQHAFDRQQGFLSKGGFYYYLRLLSLQASEEFFQRIQSHILALVTVATYRLCGFGWHRDKLLIRTSILHLVQDSALCNHNKSFLRA